LEGPLGAAPLYFPLTDTHALVRPHHRRFHPAFGVASSQAVTRRAAAA
jgi:hypothetical protein